MSLSVAYFLQDQPSVYGAERASLDLLCACMTHPELDPEVWLIQETRLGGGVLDFGTALEQTGCRIRRFPVDRAFSPSLVRNIGEASQDVQVIHAVGPKADLHLAIARTPTAKKLSTLHGWLFRKEWKERVHEWLDAWSLRRMDSVVALSTFYEQLLAERGIAAVRIPSGFDPGSVERRSVREGRHVGILGRLSSEKNHAQLLRAVAKLQDVTLLVAGEGPEEPALRTLAAELGIQDRVEFSGFIPREKVLARIDVLVLCSLVENLPYTLMEAMAAAIPVIATRAGGMPDLIEDGRTGHLVPVGDVDALAGAIGKSLAAPEGQLRAAREKLEAEFAPAKCMAAHLALYQEVCGV